jgi:acyl transferase domain-containing protein
MSDHKKEWAAYSAGTDGQLLMPIARFDYEPYFDEDSEMNQGGSTYVKHFSIQDGLELFDHRLFEISNSEAGAMDPLCRQVLEVGYLSIFTIGISKKFSNTNPLHASVSVGCDRQEWLQLTDKPQNVATNNQLAICANRFNYVFNLKGGSYVCDTACSSSLVGAHLGKMNLLEKRWDPLEWHLGLGSGVTLHILGFFGNCAAHMLSTSGRCLTFNFSANGYNRGDGTSCMCIKDGPCEEQRICFFRGSQIGQDGRSASMAAPNGPAQEKCVWGAIREAQMTPPESTVWECHGTGTSLGDPIEVGAVRRVQVKYKRLEPLMVATSKSNFGHLEGAAAQLAMCKCICCVIHCICQPTIHLNVLNPHLDHTAFDAIFISEHLPYKYRQGHCQVSSFGVGGTNGHAVFWGETAKPRPNPQKDFMKKMSKVRKSVVVAVGNDPANWEFSGPGYDAKPGEEYKIVLTRDPLTQQEEVFYEKQEVEAQEPIEFYSTSGNHNGWDDDRMIEGEVPGMFFQDLEVPESGVLEFRILAEGEKSKRIGPETTTSRMTVPIVGPSADLNTTWKVKAQPGSSVLVELMVGTIVGGPRTVFWKKEANASE